MMSMGLSGHETRTREMWSINEPNMPTGPKSTWTGVFSRSLRTRPHVAPMSTTAASMPRSWSIKPCVVNEIAQEARRIARTALTGLRSAEQKWWLRLMISVRPSSGSFSDSPVRAASKSASGIGTWYSSTCSPSRLTLPTAASTFDWTYTNCTNGDHMAKISETRCRRKHV